MICGVTRDQYIAAVRALITEGERIVERPSMPALQTWIAASDEFLQNAWGSMDRYHLSWLMVGRPADSVRGRAMTEDETADYVREVVYNKTHFGMGGESTAIAVAAEYFDLPYRFSNAEEESRGIDGWIGEHPVQVKPADSYKRNHVFNGADTAQTLVITYEKKKHTCYIWNPDFVSS